MHEEICVRSAITGDNTSEVLEGWYYCYRFTVEVKENGGWRLAAIFQEDRKERCLLVVNGKAHEAAGGVKGFQQGGQDIKGVRDQCHVISILKV